MLYAKEVIILDKVIYFVVAMLLAIDTVTLAFGGNIIAQNHDYANESLHESKIGDVTVYDRVDDTSYNDEHESVGYDSYDAPENSGFKSYMDYRTITDISSRQYMLQAYYAKTGDYGIRMVGDRYCVALGSYFISEIGQYFDIILENGTVIPCIMADQKDDVDTDESNAITVHNGCMSEFVVDVDMLDENAKIHGDMSYCTDEWNSQISEIKIYNNNVFDFD